MHPLSKGTEDSRTRDFFHVRTCSHEEAAISMLAVVYLTGHSRVLHFVNEISGNVTSSVKGGKC